MRSVLTPGVLVEAGSTVVDSVVLENAVIGRDAVVERAIIDAQAVLHEGAVVGGEGEITVVGHGLTIESERTVEPGVRLEPSEAAAPKAS